MGMENRQRILALHLQEPLGLSSPLSSYLASRVALALSGFLFLTIFSHGGPRLARLPDKIEEEED
jgi:hypothetical protein